MSGPGRMTVRQPAVGGMFYPAADEQCRTLASRLISTSVSMGASAAAGQWIGGVVPHAGWICSGASAGLGLGTIARQMTPDLVVVFGAVHTPVPLDVAVLSSFSRWAVPGGVSEVSSDLSAEIAGSGALF